MNWTDEDVATLRRLWATNLSTAEIGERLKTSKHAVVGKANRLGLAGRESPVKPSPEPRPYRPQPLPPGTRTLPPLPSELAAME